MKNTRLGSILSSTFLASALAIGSLASTPFASAQSSEPVAKANIPFAFQTQTQSLPAGEYLVIEESDHLLRLQGHKVGGFVVTHDATKSKAPARGSLVFDRLGDSYYLRQVWTAGNKTGQECTKGRAERRSMMQAKNDQSSSTIEIAAY
jgi:hypothetical protein